MRTEPELRRQLIQFSRRLHDEGYICATDGNLTVRLAGDLFLCTPSGRAKKVVEEHEILKIDIEGKVLSGDGKPTSELKVHLAAYRVRPDIRAVIHAHPIHCIAFSLAGRSLAGCLLPEVVLDLGSIPTADYATPGTEEAGEVVARRLREADAIIMDRHGSVTVGDTLEKAFHRLERMEHAARITHLALQIGDLKSLSREQIEELVERKRSGGELVGVENCNDCGACLGTVGPLPLPAFLQR